MVTHGPGLCSLQPHFFQPAGQCLGRIVPKCNGIFSSLEFRTNLLEQVLPSSARTTAVIRAAIQRNQESLQTLATRHGINPKTVVKWRKRTTTTDAVLGPMPASTVLAVEQYAMAVAFAEVRTEEGRLYLFMAINRTSKVVFAELHPRAKQMVAAEFLRRVLDKLPYKWHAVLTDNGVQFNPASASVAAGWAPL